jgi:hypothetical protein
MPPALRSALRHAAAPARAAAALAVVVAAAPAGAADLPPAAIARFTREVQPLLLNRCAAGACHGGPRAHAPQFQRGDVRGAVSSAETLANAATFRGLLGPGGDPRPLVRLLSVRHPGTSQSRTLVMPPLTARERAVLEGWLVDVQLAAGGPATRDAAVEPAGLVEPVKPPATARPNRLRSLLDTGTPPQPPPNQPLAGAIFGGMVDRRTRPTADVTPESDPPSPPPETAGSPPARPDDRASPGPTSTGSR